MTALGVLVAFLGCVAALIVYQVRWLRSSKKELQALAVQLDGSVVPHPRRSFIEILSYPDGPIKFEYRTWFYKDGGSIELTIVTVPVHLQKSVRFDMAGQFSSKEVTGYDLLRVLLGVTAYENISHRVESEIDTGDPELERNYRTYTNRPAEVKAVVERVRDVLLGAPNAAYRLDPPANWAKSRDHTVRAIFRGRFTQPEYAQQAVLAASALAAAIREQTTARPNLSGVFPTSNVTRSSLKAPDVKA